MIIYPKPYSIYLRGTIYRGYIGIMEKNMETTIYAARTLREDTM